MPRAAFICLLFVVTLIAPAHAIDDEDRASSLKEAGPSLCADHANTHAWPECKSGHVEALSRRIDSALETALRRLSKPAGVLLKRDQAWFSEMADSYAENVEATSDALRAALIKRLEARAAALETISAPPSAPAFVGRWVNAFGALEIEPVAGGAFKVRAETSSDYGGVEEKQPICGAEAIVRADASGWLAGDISPTGAGRTETADAKSSASKGKSRMRVRRQGDSLRVVTETAKGDAPFCIRSSQLTASYFPATVGSKQAELPEGAGGFVAPSFDCRSPATASEEEICADPDLAANDFRLNKTWKALLSRLDAATRSHLTRDQRRWVVSQTRQFPVFLHPYWDKPGYMIHATGYARYHLAHLQRERIALIEGFEEARTGLVGTWLASDAILQVTDLGGGRVKAVGWKWVQGSWKDGCHYEMTGKVVDGRLRVEGRSTNPDTLERDGATLIVNSEDDAAAARRTDDSEDEPKCRRRLDVSSTARLFPARPSPDIDATNGYIR